MDSRIAIAVFTMTSRGLADERRSFSEIQRAPKRCSGMLIAPPPPMRRQTAGVLLAAFLGCVACHCKQSTVTKETTKEGDAARKQQLNKAQPPPPEDAASQLPPGFFAAAAAVVPITTASGFTFNGLVFANGSDWSPQPLTMYSATLEPSFLDARPHWVSDKSGYHTGVCVGDLDGKAGVDLVVTQFKDVYGEFRSSSRNKSVEIYLSTGSASPETSFEPPTTLDGGQFRAASCAIADLDGDGISEVLVGDVGPKGYARLYQRKNTQDPFAKARTFGEPGVPVCATGVSDPLVPSAVIVADVNNDERPDLIIAGRRLAVYLSTGTGDLRARYPAQASWCSEEELGYSPSVEVARVKDPTRSLITVSKSSISPKEGKDTAWLVYDPLSSTSPLWRREPGEDVIAGPAVLTSMRGVTNDDIPDLVVATSYDRRSPHTFGFALKIFPGSAAAPHEPAAAPIEWQPDYRPVASRLLPLNLLGKRCGDLLVVSQHPAYPSTIFPDVGNCETQ